MHFGTNPFVRYLVDIRDLGLEWTARRYYSLYGGEVVANSDDEQAQSRVCVKVGILGVGKTGENKEFDPSPISRLALPPSTYAGKDHGMYFPPEIGNAVWVSFDHGDPDHPRVHGSWWRNKDPNLAASGSEIPAEFRLDKDGVEVKGPPIRRGIKTKFGHGLIFSDEEASPYVAIWSGESTTADDQVTDFKAATVKQQITLSDATGIPTVKGVDETVDAGIYANTIYGHRLALNDTAKTIMLSGLRGDIDGIDANSFTIEDTPGKLTIKTKGPVAARHEVILDNMAGTITIQTKTGPTQSIILNSTTGNIDIVTPAIMNVTATGPMNLTSLAAANVTATGALTLAAVGGIAMGSGGAPPAGAPGVAVETGQGAKIINFVGAVTETVLSMTQTVTAAFVQNAATIVQTAATSIVLTAPTISLLGGLVTIGPAPQKLMTAFLLTWLADHTHTGNLGGPTPVDPAFKALLGDATSSPFITQSFSAT